LTGFTVNGEISKIYRNDNGIFTDINAGLKEIAFGSCSWGDYDNDGDLDILLSGAWITKIYRNDNGVFTDINAGLANVVWVPFPGEIMIVMEIWISIDRQYN